MTFPAKSKELVELEREHAILNARRSYAEEKMSLGKKAFMNKKCFLAFSCYKEAIDALSKPKLESTSLYQEALYSLNQTAVVLILKNASLFQYANAKRIISIITNKTYYFEYPPALFLVKKFSAIKAQEESNLLPEKAEELKKVLFAAIDFYQLGEWNMASNSYKTALHLDPNNVAALIGLELINQEQNEHINAAVTEQKNEMIDNVDKSWELPSANYNNASPPIIEQAPTPIRGTRAILHKIRSIKIPKIDFFETPFQSALEQLKKKAFLLDTSENDPNKKGVNIVLALDIKKLIPEPKITLLLTDAPLEEILKYIVKQAHLKIKIEPYAVAIIPEEESSEVLITKEYKVLPSFIAKFPAFSNHDSLTDNKNTSKKIEDLSIKDILLSQGITFPPGAAAHYLVSNNILIVKNSQANLDLIDCLVENSFSTPLNQVEVEARFLEVRQNNIKERGLDWLLGAFQLGSNINTGGGTVANQANYQPSNYPIQSNSVPVGTIIGGPPGAGSVTSGNRTGTAAINANALETLLFGGSAGPATGILALAGVLTNPQFQVVLRAINQHKGVELLSAPKITVSSGKRASIKVAREFPYPADYSPPQVPQNQGTSVNPAIPSTPSSFKKRNVGVQLEVEPIINSDDNSVELNLSPQVVEFQGFVNYGNPIFSQAPVFLAGQTNIAAATAQVLLTQNTINQPVFSVSQVDTQVTLRDGQTVVLGGLMREDIKKVDDKIPIIGNIPLVGSLFRSSSEQKIKRNLLIFVTVHLLDPSGQKANIPFACEN